MRGRGEEEGVGRRRRGVGGGRAFNKIHPRIEAAFSPARFFNL